MPRVTARSLEQFAPSLCHVGGDRHPNDRELLYTLAGYQRDAGQLGRALSHARRLATLEPADASIRAFIAELETRR